MHASQPKLAGSGVKQPLIPPSANVAVEQQLHSALRSVENAFAGDALGLVGSMYYGVEDFIRDALERRPVKTDKLIVIVDTEGGYIEVVQRIADTIRYHYPKSVEFVIPNYAMSAGTVLVMSGDAIHMDYYSVLGPIDPQVLSHGKWVPALGYLEKFQELMQKASTKKGLNDAEMAYLASHFDPADLYSYEQAKKLSTQLLKQWLVKYKFKDWNQTETHHKKVTLRMKEKRAAEIADELNNTKRWNSHAGPFRWMCSGMTSISRSRILVRFLSGKNRFGATTAYCGTTWDVCSTNGLFTWRTTMRISEVLMPNTKTKGPSPSARRTSARRVERVLRVVERARKWGGLAKGSTVQQPFSNRLTSSSAPHISGRPRLGGS